MTKKRIAHAEKRITVEVEGKSFPIAKIIMPNGEKIEISQSLDNPDQLIVRSGRDRMLVLPVATNAIELKFE